MAGQRPPREKTLGQYNNQSKLVDSHWRRNKQLPDLAGSDLDFVSLGGRRTQTVFNWRGWREGRSCCDRLAGSRRNDLEM